MTIFANIASVYDGTSSDVTSLHSNVDIEISSGRIKSINRHNPEVLTSTRVQSVDCSELTVTPGIIDCHGHITSLGLASSDIELENSQAGILYIEKVLHKSLVEGGVTTMRDVGGATHFMKRMVDEGVMIGPRLKIAICMLSTTGGHADFRSPDRCHADLSKLWPEGPGRPSSIIDGPWEARKRVREIAACGADLIKICASPGVASPSDHLEHQDFSREEISAICSEAEARGLKVAAHAHSINGINMAIDHGVKDIQHISFMGKAQAEKAYEAGCTVTPTSWIMSALLEADGLSEFVRDKAKAAAESHSEAVAYAISGGLPILAGTDPVLPGMHGRNYMELHYLIKDGMRPLQAWHAATGLAAAEIGQTDSGTIAIGQRADMLFSRGNVVNQPELLDAGAMVEVMKDGECYKGGLGLGTRTFASSIDQALERKAR